METRKRRKVTAQLPANDSTKGKGNGKVKGKGKGKGTGTDTGKGKGTSEGTFAEQRPSLDCSPEVWNMQKTQGLDLSAVTLGPPTL